MSYQQTHSINPDPAETTRRIHTMMGRMVRSVLDHVEVALPKRAFDRFRARLFTVVYAEMETPLLRMLGLPPVERNQTHDTGDSNEQQR